MLDLGLKILGTLIHYSPKNKGLLFFFLNPTFLNHFSFKPETLDDAVNVVKRIEIIMYWIYPQKLLKENVDLFSPFLLNFVNMSVKSSTSSVLKLANVNPGHKKDSCYQSTVGLSVFYPI